MPDTPQQSEVAFPMVSEELLPFINARVAAVFCQRPKPVRFVFLHYIANPRGKLGECLGLCVRCGDGAEIQLKACPGWQNTAVHELVHLYNPGKSEKTIKALTVEVIRLWKAAVENDA